MQKFNGKQYLQIDIANNFGLDKLSWNDRLHWFKANEHCLMELLPQAQEPALYYAGVMAWQDVKAGLPSGYPISLDATSSGLQILAALTGDRAAAEICNVVDTGSRQDAYSSVYLAMLKKIGENSKIKRDDTKQAIMTALYGSQAVPKEVFGEGLLLKVFFNTMKEMAPAAWELNEAFLDMWDADAIAHSWVLPDNFHVIVKVMDSVKEVVHFLNEPIETFRKVNQATKEGRSLGANSIHSIDGMIVREIGRRCDYNMKKVREVQRLLFTVWEAPDAVEPSDTNDMLEVLWNHYTDTGYLSARILDYITEENVCFIDRKVMLELIDSLPKKPFKVLAVHDCFRCLPSYGNDLREQYNRQLMLIASSNLLGNLISQIVGRPVSIGKLDPSLSGSIMDADYALS